MNKRVQKYREGFHSHSYKYDRFDPPLRIVAAVVSRWGPGDAFQYVKKKVMSLNLVTMGNATYEQGPNRGIVGRGEVFLAHKGASQVFKTGSEGFLHKRSILIDGVALDTLLRTTNLANYDYIRPVDIVRTNLLFRQAYYFMKNKPAGFTLALSRIVFDILTELGRSIAPEYPPAVQSAIEHMRRNLHQPLEL
jgi:hypothetical protein